MPTSSFSLPNGLRFIHHRDDTTAMIALNTLYNVGARDEASDLTGVAHLFEHLMFGGSVNIPDFDGSIERAGGWSNAWTNNDFTNFYDVVPAVNAETAFWLESDRMLGLAFAEKNLEVQRQVVIEEFKQVCLNKPYGDLGHQLRKLLYTVHPYRYPTIGADISHLEKVTMKDVEDFYYHHYAPNNAVIAVAGAISLEECKELAQKWFGDIPTRAIKTRLYSAEPPILAPRRQELERNVPQTTILIAFPMGAYHDPDYVASDIITDVLANGRSARFYKRLVLGSDLFTEVDASILGSEEPGYLLVSAKLRSNDRSAIQKAEDAIWSELDRLVSEGATSYELTRAVNRFESNHTFGALNFLAKAQALASCCVHEEDINEIVGRYRAVTPEQLQKVASHLLRRQSSVTLIYHSTDTSAS
ncbi:MAG: insulinase family protein [Bacteroidales bacterium]|nr:insulinase family protein [Bacteroidales bacterium]